MLKLVRLHAAYVCGFQLSKILMISLVGLNHTGGHNYIAFPGIFTQRARFASSAVELPCARVCVSMNVCLPFAFYLRNMTSTHGTPMCVCVGVGGMCMCACSNVKPDKPQIYLLWQKCVSYSPGAWANWRGAEASSSSSLYYLWAPMVLLPWRSSKTMMQCPAHCCSNTITVFQQHLGLSLEILNALRIAS